MTEVTTARLVRAVRHGTGLSQRALGELVGTSGPTIADYEAGHKEPRWSTLERIAAASGYALEATVTPRSKPLAALHRQRQLRRAIAAATAVRVNEDWPAAKKIATQNLKRMRTSVMGPSARRWLARWQTAVDLGPKAVRKLLLAGGDDGDDLRQVAPFAGVLSDAERRLVLAAAPAHER